MLPAASMARLSRLVSALPTARPVARSIVLRLTKVFGVAELYL